MAASADLSDSPPPADERGPADAPPLLEVRDLRVTYARRRMVGRAGDSNAAVRGVSLSVPRGATLGLVGESGSGKTTTGLAVINLVAATGSVTFDGREILGLAGTEMRLLRRRMQMVFQDPSASLDPRMTVRQLIGVPVKAHAIAAGNQAVELIVSLLEKVALNAGFLGRYPHQLSGGQRQRVAIARSLVTSPEFIVCDEVTSSLDVSVQAQVVNLLMDLQADLGLTLLFISHNLGVVRQVSQSIAVMYLGTIVESGPAEQIYARAAHPYTRALLEAMPSPDPDAQELHSRVYLRADTVGSRDAASVPVGCVYADRCPFATSVCRETVPELLERADGHRVACHHADQVWAGLPPQSKGAA
jgi:oligopeptide/dipeptide ABC transporter ATP-binding protein